MLLDVVLHILIVQNSVGITQLLASLTTTYAWYDKFPNSMYWIHSLELQHPRQGTHGQERTALSFNSPMAPPIKYVVQTLPRCELLYNDANNAKWCLPRIKPKHPDILRKKVKHLLRNVYVINLIGSGSIVSVKVFRAVKWKVYDEVSKRYKTHIRYKELIGRGSKWHGGSSL